MHPGVSVDQLPGAVEGYKRLRSSGNTHPPVTGCIY